ncbi:hypothetical protein MCC93_09790 [Morococcus cerebrosus]|uniref:Uncharacterized protein n=1 Tax=Morococcus cerebrosus TaxID=1056807 RepID=A0A0C1EAU3_9NEIS|nr:hypothetical protein MCC93_09790 [Morococcus cerebrosus]
MKKRSSENKAYLSDDLLPSASQTAKLFTLFLLETYAHMKDPEQSSMTARRFSCVSI